MGYILLGLVAGFLAVILFRALTFKPKVLPKEAPSPIDFDKDAAVDALQQLVRCKTVSCNDKELEDDGEFQKLIGLLPQLYPHVFDTCSFDQLPDRALLFHWKGRESGEPAVLMAHYDVVPANDAQWEKPPFAAILEDGVLWGRGTLDTKVTFNGVLSAANHLIGQGYQPRNDIYFAFSGGEEVNGPGARRIVQFFADNHITPGIVVDEGGDVVENVFPGVKQPCGLIGIAEKGMVNVQYKVRSAGGHASAPKPHTPVGVLSRACARVENHPFPCHMDGPARQMFDTLGRHSTFGYKVIFANFGLFGWVINLLAKKSGGEMNALIRTTSAFTQMSGSPARNVIPTEASMTANMRLNPSDSVSSTLARLKKTVKDPHVEISTLESFEPSRVSRTNCPAWNTISDAVAETWPGCIVSPYLMVQCSDSRHYGAISDRVYRFSAMALTADERATIHGNNERIRVEAIGKAVEFYIRLMEKC